MILATISDKDHVGLCYVPNRPSREDRFKSVAHSISYSIGIEDLSSNFICIKEYPANKSGNKDDRKYNVLGAFSYKGNIDKKTVVLFDDVITTGETVLECVRTLEKSGAQKVIVFVLGITQYSSIYWLNGSCINKLIESDSLRYNSNTMKPIFKINDGFEPYDDVIERLLKGMNDEINSYDVGDDDIRVF